MQKKVLVISVDSLFFDDIRWFLECPNLYEIYKKGSIVKRVQSTYPAMTYVAHSTMMTGCYEETHGIYHNEKIEVGKKYPQWHWYRKDLKVNTIMDAAKKRGYTTTVINWPVTGGDRSVDYLVPEIWSDDPSGDSTERFLSVCSKGMDKLYEKYRHLLNWKYQPQLDNFGVACLKEIISQHEPDLIMLHLSYLDHARHKFGGFSKEAKESLMACDKKIGEIFDALRACGNFEAYDIFIMGDHGHMPVEQIFNPNVLLVNNGMIDLDSEGKIKDYKCYIHSAGLSAHVILKDPEDQKVKKEVKKFLDSLVDHIEYGCERIFTEDELNQLHLTGPFSFGIEGRLGTSFGNSYAGQVICPTDNSDYKLSVSGHGHLPDKGPQPVFFAAGPDIKQGVSIETGCLIDQAPTYAAVLGVEMPWAEGKAIQEILK